MKTSLYFTELFKSYLAEIDDLFSDTEGKSVLQRRLKEKRSELAAILPMIDFSPEMVAVIFYDAFEFRASDTLAELVRQEPEFRAWPRWATLAAVVKPAAWAEPLIRQTLAAPGGDTFLVATAGLEFLRVRGAPGAWAPAEDLRDEDDDDTEDLGEAGSEWLSEQGFEPTSEQ